MTTLPEDLAATSLTLARRFAAGATMWCTSRQWGTHGRHVAVEFVHPVIVGKRALPAVFVDHADILGAVRLLARPGDVVLALGPADDDTVCAVLRCAGAWGLASVWLGAGARPETDAADHVVWAGEGGRSADHAARSGDLVPLYHLLWELTQVVFEHPGLLDRSAGGASASSDEPTAFLYPFIEGAERDATGLLADLAASARAKLAASERLRSDTLDRCGGAIHAAATEIADRYRSGGRLYAFGNGGSATDAEAAVGLFSHPPRGRPLAAMSLVADPAVLSALANDVGFDLVFSRQLIAHARSGDVAVGFSTSGDSADVLRAFTEARRRGLLTVGLSGYEGGSMARSESVDHCLVVRSESVHRIQEVQAAIVFALWSTVQSCLAEPGDG